MIPYPAPPRFLPLHTRVLVGYDRDPGTIWVCIRTSPAQYDVRLDHGIIVRVSEAAFVVEEQEQKPGMAGPRLVKA